jgi:hypothetical protein
MFFKDFTVFGNYKTRRGAEAYIAKYFSNNPSIKVEEIGGLFYVVG